MNVMMSKEDGPQGRIRYFINCPLDTFDLRMMHKEEVKVMEIPRKLAEYIQALQNEIEHLKKHGT